MTLDIWSRGLCRKFDLKKKKVGEDLLEIKPDTRMNISINPFYWVLMAKNLAIEKNEFTVFSRLVRPFVHWSVTIF